MRIMKRGTKVEILRSEIAPSLASVLPSFIFYNTGTVSKIEGDRVEVKYPDGKYWFDLSAVRAVK